METIHSDDARLKERPLIRRPWLHIVLVLVLGLVVYANTFDVPFQWDDDSLIKENEILKDLRYFSDPSMSGGYYLLLRDRFVGYLSFALDYSVHRLDVTGYHAVNTAIHLANAALVYLLVILIFRTPALGGTTLARHRSFVAFFASAVFVAHPLQTEAVTYILQRLASMAAFFYLLSVVAYAWSRLSDKKRSRYVLYGLSLVSAVLAMKTKENAFTLPLAITLLELSFFKARWKQRLVWLAPMLLTLFIIPLSHIKTSVPDAFTAVSMAASQQSDYSRLEYFLTQFNVMATYLRLLVLPVNQNLDYDYPVAQSFASPGVLAALALHLAMLLFGGYCYVRSRTRSAGWRVVGFGIFWFYIALSVESGLIPLTMLIDEYRAYLPGVGLIVSIAFAGAMLMENIGGKGAARKALVVAAVAFPLVLGAAAVHRNTVWQSRVSLWEDTVRKSPWKAEAYVNLADSYARAGMDDQAFEFYKYAVRLSPLHPIAHHGLGYQYLKRGQLLKARQEFETALMLKPDYFWARTMLQYIEKLQRSGKAPSAIPPQH